MKNVLRRFILSKVNIITFLFFIIPLYGQQPAFSVELLAPLPTASDISLLRQINGNSYLAALSGSDLFRSDNGGRTWFTTIAPSYYEVGGLQLLSPQRWYGITRSGEFFFTISGGERFVTQKLSYATAPSNKSFLSFIDSLSGVVRFYPAENGKGLFITINGGVTWQVKDGPPALTVGEVEMFPGRIMIVNCGNAVYRSVFLGSYWDQTFSKTSSDFFKLNDSTAYMFVKNDSTYITTNKGSSWKGISKCFYDLLPNEMIMLPSGNIYATDSFHNKIYRSTDTCKTFTLVKDFSSLNPARNFKSFLMTSDTTGVVSGERGLIGLLSGRTLELKFASKNNLLPSNAFYLDSNFAVNIWGNRTVNGGKSWQFSNFPTGMYNSGSLVKVTKAGLGVIAFNSYTNPLLGSMTTFYSYIYATRDSGRTWKKMATDINYKTVSLMNMGDSLIVALLNKTDTIGTQQRIKLVSSSEGPISVTNQALKIKITGAISYPARKQLIGSSGNKIYLSEGSAEFWNEVFGHAQSVEFKQLTASESGYVVAMSKSGIYSWLSSDFGKNWGRAYPSTSLNLDFPTVNSNGIVAGAKLDYIYYGYPSSTDWTKIPYKLVGSVINLQFIGANILFVQTDKGCYYKFTINDTTTSISESEPAQPTNYSLQQNYPNPFNPSTVISFSLPIDEKVELSVYNLLGEKVVELVNSELLQGNHEVAFDATTLPSGIYFYRLYTPHFSETKKMILLR
jgi:photosystem II stability/assembly factor-like uncharacterized protein